MRFRKKPVVIDAVEWDGSDEAHDQVEMWAADTDCCLALQSGCLFIDTLEGEMRADRGDWIIRGVKGEIYPCKPDIFEATYEIAE